MSKANNKSLKITIYGDHILRKITSEIPAEQISKPKYQNLAFNMLNAMYKNRGVGLAAPQVSSNASLTVIDTQWAEGEGTRPYILFNPIIIDREGEMLSDEGCLSFPAQGKYSALNLNQIPRSQYVKVQYHDLKGKVQYIEAENDLLCRCLQHEIDHLKGILFIDRYTLQDDLIEILEQTAYLPIYLQEIRG